MEAFVNNLRQDYPSLTFVPGTSAQWSPGLHTVTYVSTDSPAAMWSLLHEVGHALLDHTTYASDANLLQKETEAWVKAEQLAKKYGITIDDGHIQQCLDTYREWLHKRSTCPTCGSHGLQRLGGLYACLNCKNEWQVTSERFCRPYRLKKHLQLNTT